MLDGNEVGGHLEVWSETRQVMPGDVCRMAEEERGLMLELQKILSQRLHIEHNIDRLLYLQQRSDFLIQHPMEGAHHVSCSNFGIVLECLK